jgi:hypothetical protein
MRVICPVVLACCLVDVGTAAAEPLQVKAENDVPVTMIEASRTADFTLIGLRAQVALTKVCWNADGDNSPYLLADGRRYRYVGGNNLTTCPSQRDYAAGEIMVLSFERLGPEVHDFSLVEGRGGESQLVDPTSSATRFWNFLRVHLK